MTNNVSHIDSSAPTLVIFCKRPLVGQGKSRLAKSIGVKEAYLVAVELLNCALEDAANWQGNIVFTVTSSADIEWAKALMIGRHTVIQQIEGNLGDKINHIDTTLRSSGHTKLAFIGTDAPALTQQHYAQTAFALERSDYIFSPADDGGVGIMANTVPWPPLTDLPWSTSKLAVDLVEKCTQFSQKIELISSSYDVDEQADLIKTFIGLSLDKRQSRIQLRNVLAPIVAKNREPLRCTMK